MSEGEVQEEVREGGVEIVTDVHIPQVPADK